MDNNNNNSKETKLHQDNNINNNLNNSKFSEESPRKPQQILPNNNSNITSERLKRDEWSEGAVSCLLEAYEAKWTLRNRAKLKGQDWEEVAKHVSARANSAKSPKTQTQCKNKIESMKKRYRSESATAATDNMSSWPLYSRLHHLLRGNNVNNPPPSPAVAAAIHQGQGQQHHHGNLVLIEQQQVLQQQPLVALPGPPPPPLGLVAGNVERDLQGSSDGGDNRLVKEGAVGGPTKLSDHESDKIPVETSNSTPATFTTGKDKTTKNANITKPVGKKRRRRENGSEIAESIRWLGEVVVRAEEARMETMRELERMRCEAEAKRGEIDLKRTEIIANTQLEIAKLFAAAGSGKSGVDSSLRIGRS